jgi:hypothetical protein
MKKFLQKNYKVILLIVVLVLVGVLAYVTFNNNKHFDESDVVTREDDDFIEKLEESSEKEDAGESVFFINKSDIATFAFTDNNGIYLTFEKKDDEWILKNETTLDIDEERVDTLLNYLSNVRFVDAISTEEPEKYGLTMESPIFSISDSNDNTTIITLGNVNEETGEVYYAINYDYSNVFVNSGKISNISTYSIEDLIATK